MGLAKHLSRLEIVDNLNKLILNEKEMATKGLEWNTTILMSVEYRAPIC
jgi:hypothetical protein